MNTTDKTVYTPKVGEIQIDKLAMVFNTSYSIERFTEYVKEEPKARFNSRLYTVGIRLPGAEAYQYDTSNQTSITLEVGPKGKNSTQFQCRLEYNPAKVPPSYILTMLQDIFDIDYMSHVMAGRVTRLDLAVDISVPLDELLFDAKKFSTTENKYSSGRTLYIGGIVSPLMFRIYDKGAEIKTKNKNADNPTLHELVPTSAITRVELVVKPKAGIETLLSLANPFMKLRIFHVGELKKIQANDVKKMFLLNAQHVGVYPARMHLSQTGLKEIDSFLSSAPVAWWQPDHLWKEHYPNALNPILFPLKPVMVKESQACSS